MHVFFKIFILDNQTLLLAYFTELALSALDERDHRLITLPPKMRPDTTNKSN